MCKTFEVFSRFSTMFEHDGRTVTRNNIGRAMYSVVRQNTIRYDTIVCI